MSSSSYLPQYEMLGSKSSDSHLLSDFPFHNNNAYLSTYNDLNALDPYLNSLQVYEPQYHSSAQSTIDLRWAFTTYNPSAHGFKTSLQRQNSENLNHLGISTSWPEDVNKYRFSRYPSPTDNPGLAMSSTDSSTSEYVLSPETVRMQHENSFPNTKNAFFGSPLHSSPVAPSSWLPEQCLPQVLPSTPNTIHHATSYNPRDLQLTPDPQVGEGPLDDKDYLTTKLPHPEEVEYVEEQADSPRDSGIGQSVRDDETMKDEEEDSGAVESDNDSEFVPARPLRRRPSGTRHSQRNLKSSSARTTLSNKVFRVQKRTLTQSKTFNNSRSKSKRPSLKQNTPAKSFPCTFHHFGCPATFANKNEWKRHVASQHLQLGFFRCDMGICSPNHVRSQNRGYNDFNRKDLFTQHCRRMHAPWVTSKKNEDQVTKEEKDDFEEELENIRSRCWIDRRKAPESTSCGFCTKTFVDGAENKSWEERMEHVGRHFERDGCKAEEENVDQGLRDWAFREGLLTGGKKGKVWLVGYEPAETTRATGRRRSKRHAEKEGEDEEEKEAEEENNEMEEDDDEADNASQDEITVENAAIEGEESDSDIDAEAEDE